MDILKNWFIAAILFLLAGVTREILINLNDPYWIWVFLTMLGLGLSGIYFLVKPLISPD